MTTEIQSHDEFDPETHAESGRFGDDYLATKDDDELLEMRDNWALNADELESVEDELEDRNGGVNPRIAADDDTEERCDQCGGIIGRVPEDGGCKRSI